MSTQPNSELPESPHPMKKLVVTEKEIYKKIMLDLLRKEANSIKEDGEKTLDYTKEVVDRVDKRDPDEKILCDKAIKELILCVESSNTEVSDQHWNNYKTLTEEIEKLKNEKKMAEAIEKVENLNVDPKEESDETVQQNPNTN